MDAETGWRVTRVKMWEAGHSFDEIDNMPITDISDVIGVWSGKAKGEAKRAKTRERLNRK